MEKVSAKTTLLKLGDKKGKQNKTTNQERAGTEVPPGEAWEGVEEASVVCTVERRGRRGGG